MNRSEGQHSCPSIDELKGFSIGRLPEPALGRFAAHIEAPCPRCEAALEELEHWADPLLADLREPPPISAAEAEEACRCVLEHMLGLVVSTTDEGLLWPPDIAATLDKTPPEVPGLKTLVAPIGEPGGWPKMGGMGAVWLVRDRQFERPLVLKVMKSVRANSDRIRRFLNEARITARLAHPSVVPVHAMGWLADGRPYYTMKLVEGDTLADRLKPGSDVTSRMYLLQVFARVCQALAFAHNNGVIHRDLKPIHVMVGAHGEVYIIDWGLAKVLGQSDVLAPAESSPWPKTTSSMDGQAMGTGPYMPPEQANGRIKEMDRRSDVFGLGGILCVILTGKPPYLGPTPKDVMRQASDTALALRVLAGPDDRDPFSLPAIGEKELSLEGDLCGLRLTFCPRPTGVPVEAEVAEAAEKTARLLKRRGVKVVPRKDPLPRAPLDALRVIFRAAALADAGIKDEADFRKKRDLLTGTFAAFVEPGLKLTLRDYLEAQAQVTTFLEQSAPDYWKDCDVLAIPTLAVPPFSTKLPLGPEQVCGENVDPQVGWTFTWPFNLTGQPAISIPCGWTKEGLPLGLQLVGRRGADGLVLRVAAAIEALAPWSDRRPKE